MVTLSLKSQVSLWHTFSGRCGALQEWMYTKKTSIDALTGETAFLPQQGRSGDPSQIPTNTGKSGLDPDLEDSTMTTVHYQAPTGCQFCWRYSAHIPLMWVLRGGCSTTSQAGKQAWWSFVQEKRQHEQRWMPCLSLAGTEGRSRTSLFYNSHYKCTL